MTLDSMVYARGVFGTLVNRRGGRSAYQLKASFGLDALRCVFTPVRVIENLDAKIRGRHDRMNPCRAPPST